MYQRSPRTAYKHVTTGHTSIKAHSGGADHSVMLERSLTCINDFQSAHIRRSLPVSCKVAIVRIRKQCVYVQTSSVQKLDQVRFSILADIILCVLAIRKSFWRALYILLDKILYRLSRPGIFRGGCGICTLDDAVHTVIKSTLCPTY